jgi:hypothetical protein
MSCRRLLGRRPFVRSVSNLLGAHPEFEQLEAAIDRVLAT